MIRTTFLDLIQTKKFLVSDGATGTNLIKRGLISGKTPEHWVLENPDAISSLHQDFIRAGSDIILTSTFGGSRIRLHQSGLADRFEEINIAAVKLAKSAAIKNDTLVAGSIGPLGHMLKPLGSLDKPEAEENYRDQAKILSKAGVDILLIETQFDLTEAMIAVNSALKVSELPVIVSFSFDRGTKTMMGVSPKQFANEFRHAGVSAMGINCGKSLEDNLSALNELSASTDLPIWFKPNAGLPKIGENGQPIYNITPVMMGSHATDWLKNGAKIIGGCCGTTPQHLNCIAQTVKEYS